MEETKVVDSEAQVTSAVSLTAPIWKTSPELWFIETEEVLRPKKMSGEAKYQVVITKLSKDVIEHVTDVLVSPPETKKFETLKNRLISIYEESEDRQLKKLIGEMELGSKNPLNYFENAISDKKKMSQETLAVLWQNHLPAAVRGVLAVGSAEDIDTLASLAYIEKKTLKNTKNN